MKCWKNREIHFFPIHNSSLKKYETQKQSLWEPFAAARRFRTFFFSVPSPVIRAVATEKSGSLMTRLECEFECSLERRMNVT